MKNIDANETHVFTRRVFRRPMDINMRIGLGCFIMLTPNMGLFSL